MANIKVGFGKYVWITGATSVVAIFTILTLMGLIIECDDVKVCDELHCEVYCTVTNRGYTSVYLFNHDDWQIRFSPEVENFELYAKYYGKWSFTNFTRETRFPNIPDARKYVFVFPRYSKKEFKMVVDLKDAEIVKYDFGALDPILIGWKVVYENLSRQEPVAWKENVKDVCWYGNETVKGGCESYEHKERVPTAYKTVYYPGKKIGVSVGGKPYYGRVNVDDDNLCKFNYDVGDRNFIEFPCCTDVELDKELCDVKKLSLLEVKT